MAMAAALWSTVPSSFFPICPDWTLLFALLIVEIAGPPSTERGRAPGTNCADDTRSRAVNPRSGLAPPLHAVWRRTPATIAAADRVARRGHRVTSLGSRVLKISPRRA